MSKPVTAVAAMILIEEGVIRLDDPVDGFLPELANVKVHQRVDSPLDDVVPVNRAIMVRDLLTFTLGTGLIFALPGTYPIQEAIDQAGLGPGAPDPSRQPAPDEWIRRLASLPLLYQPGDRWMYNIGSEVLSVLISRASGRRLDDFMRERIFDPLGMRDTGFWVSADAIDRLVTSHEIASSIGKYGWDGGMGTSWYSDPAEEMVTILMTQVSWSSPNPPNVFRDFWTLSYSAIDD